MELFKITCVTCRARLSVRDAALVGQIIGCPRCGMMVQVVAPAGSATAGTPIAAAAAAAAASPAVDLQAGGIAPESIAPAAHGAEPIATFDDAALLAESPPAMAAGPPTAPGAPPASTLAARWGGRRFALLLTGGAIAGSAVVAAALSWFSAEDHAAVTAPASAATAEVAASDAPAPDAPPAPASAPAPAPETLLPLEEPQPVEPSAEASAAPSAIPATQNATELPTTAAASEPAEAADANQPPVDQPATEPPSAQQPTDEQPPAEVAAEASAAPPQLRIDPLDVDPEGLNLSALYSGPPKDPLAASELPDESTPPPSAPPAGDDQPPAPARQPAVRRDEQAGVGAPADAAALLSRRLPSVKADKMPLCQFINLAAQVSGLPVSVSPAELRMAAVSAETPATVDVKDTTVEGLLTAALQPLRLKPVVEGEQIVLRRSAADNRRTVNYPVDDLASTPAAVEQLGEWVQQFAAPAAWNGAGAAMAVDAATLRVEAPESVQFDVLLMLERCRAARGLPTRTKYPAALVASQAFHAAVADRMAAPAVFTFSRYTPLEEIFGYWQDELAVSVLIDWPALAEERLWPNTRIATSAADKSWAEALDAVLEPLGAGWRAVGRNSIEITSLTKIRGERMLEVYRVKADAENVVARVQSLADNGAPPAAIAYDPDARLLLVLQGAAAHRKLFAELGDLLAPIAAH